MAYTIAWYIKDKVLYAQLSGYQSVEEVREASLVVVKHLDDSPEEKIHFIIDDSQLTSIPFSISALQQALVYGRHPRLGWVVMVGKSPPAIRRLLITLARIFNVRFHRVEKFEGACDFLKEKYPHIDWSAAEKPLFNR